MTDILFIEPFYGGSHKQLVDLLLAECNVRGYNAALHTLPAKKWHWRARVSALHFAQVIPLVNTDCHCLSKQIVLFSSSVLNLSELLGLRPDLTQCYKIVYFHENQLVYPVRHLKDRDFQYGYSQVVSCLAADLIIFNSSFNQESFLKNLKTFFSIVPDHRPKGLEEQIRPRCRVCYFPVTIPDSVSQLTDVSEIKGNDTTPLRIVWPHRWEHDKDPDTFFMTILKLKDEGYNFQLSVLGETFSDVPEIFEEARSKLNGYILHWGHIDSKEEYYNILSQTDVVVSTAKHEFFGVAVLEAVVYGCYPLLPNKLSYPEIYPNEYLYNTPNQLYKELRRFCQKPSLVRQHVSKVDFKKYSWENLRDVYMAVLKVK